MSIDFESLLVPVFPGINNQPTAPTATQAGNGSHLIKLHNDLVNSLEVNFKYIILDNSSDYSVFHGENLIVRITDSQLININLPSSPAVGTWFSIFNTNGAVTVDFLNYGTYRSGSPQRVFLPNEKYYQTVKFIYTGSELGWIVDKLNIVEEEFGVS